MDVVVGGVVLLRLAVVRRSGIGIEEPEDVNEFAIRMFTEFTAANLDNEDPGFVITGIPEDCD